MGKNDIIYKLSMNQIFTILQKLGGMPKWGSNNNIISKTICHGGDNHKLIYYENNRLFICYTGCENANFNIIELVKKVKKCGTYEALDFISSITGISISFVDNSEGFEEYEEDDEDDLFLSNHKKEYVLKEPKVFKKSILRTFYDLYHISFIKDNISKQTMKKFGLKFDIFNNRIIIPHYYHNNGSLVAIRCRNLNRELIDEGRKYTPITINNLTYVSPTATYIYGLHLTKENIKKYKMIVLFESEKSVMQMETYFPETNCSGATMGSFLRQEQINILLELGVEEVIIAFDKEYKNYKDEEYLVYQKKIRKSIIEKLLPYFKVTIIVDKQNVLQYKDSPSDRGVKTFKKLFQERVYIRS